jgi:hypothetical protein
MTDIEDQIRALEGLDFPALVLRYQQLTGKPPRRRFRQYLVKRCAYAIQERAFGGLSRVAQKRIAELAAEIKLSIEISTRNVRARYPGVRPGTTLVRVWKGEEHRVLVHPEGFEWREQMYPSLSAVASAITGTRWNGRIFFNLPKQP